MDAYRRSDLQLLQKVRLLGRKPSSAGLAALRELQRFRRAPQTALPLLQSFKGFPWQAVILLKALRLHQVEIDVFHVNVVLDICSKAGAWALSLASAVQAEADLPLDAVSFGSLTHACALRGHWMQGCHVIDSMCAQVNLITYGSLLHGLAGARRWAYAMQLLHLLRFQQRPECLRWAVAPGPSALETFRQRVRGERSHHRLREGWRLGAGSADPRGILTV